MQDSSTQKSRPVTRQARRRQRALEDATVSMNPGTPLGAGFRPLSEADVLRIHRAALDLLAEVGMARSTPRLTEVALGAGCSLTDEASAMELADYQPLIVEGHADNIKITRPEDLTLAAFYLQQQGNS